METNRRDFIKAFSAMAAAGLFSSRMPWLSELQAQDLPETVKLGIIGVGSRGALLQTYLLEIPGVEISCFCDDYEPHFDRAQQMIGKGTRGYRDYRRMLEREDMDGVVIATPLDRIIHSDGTDMEMESFVSDVRNNRVDPFITHQGFYASIATLMGFEAMMTNRIESWPEGLHPLRCVAQASVDYDDD